MQYRGAIAILTGIVVLLLSQWAGLIGVTDHLLYDRLVRITPARHVAPEELLIVEATPEETFRGDECWLQVLQTIQSMKPKAVIFTFFPGAVSSAFYDAAIGSDTTWFGRGVVPVSSLEGRSAWKFISLPDAASGKTPRTAALFWPALEEGISRHMPVSVVVDGQSVDGLEYAVAGGSRSPNASVIPAGGFLVNFNGEVPQLPRAPLSRVLDQGLVPALVEGRYVLIGVGEERSGSGFSTPIGGGGMAHRAMDELEYRGFALATLLENSEIREVPAWVGILVAALVLLLGLFLYPQASGQLAFWVMGGVFVITIVTAWVLLSYALIWPPCAAPLFANVLIYALVFRTRQEAQEQQIQQLDYRIRTRISERFFPKGFFVTDDHWAQVVAMVSQMLDLKRMIFLERVEGDHRVREVKALNCSLSDIHEMRRDYERIPYSTAIEVGGPIRVEERIFFKTDGTAETQYLTPLAFGGQVMGFWAFGVEPGSEGDLALFHQSIRDFAVSISELLYRRRQWQASNAKQPGFLGRSMLLAGDSAVVNELGNSFNLVDRRMTVMGQTFDRLSTATVLYDIFGNVMQINERMLELLRACNLQPFDLTAGDLAAALTGTEPSIMRRNLWSLATERRPLHFVANILGEGGMFLLMAHPVIDNEPDWSSGEARPFQLLGILLELVDASAFQREYEVREKIMETVARRLRVLMFGSETAVVSERPAKGESADYSRLLDALESRSDILPVDLVLAVDNQIQESAPTFEERAIRIQWDKPAKHCLVCADDMGTKRALEAMLRYLSVDAAENSDLTLSVTEENGLAHLVMFNTGFGVPDTIFQQSLSGDDARVSGGLGRLRTSAQWARECQGNLYGRSEVGTGTRLELELRLYL